MYIAFGTLLAFASRFILYIVCAVCNVGCCSSIFGGMTCLQHRFLLLYGMDLNARQICFFELFELYRCFCFLLNAISGGS